MKISYSRLLLMFIIFSVLSCSSYSIKTDVEESSILKKIKKTGIIFRIPNSSKITKEESIKNFLSWLTIYQKNENIIVINDASDSLTYFNNPQQRFYQLSNENTYLKYKSIGVLNQYLQNNQNELLNIISKNNLDSITIFEVYSIISTQMQFFEFESVLAVVDSNLNLAYLDHQSDYFESESSILNELKNQMLDIINNRLMNHLYDVNLLGKKDEKAKRKLTLSKDISKPEDKAKVKTPEKQKYKQAEKSAEKALEKPKKTPPISAEKSKEKTAEKSKDAAKENQPSEVIAETKKEAVPATVPQETKTKETQPATKPTEKDISKNTPVEKQKDVQKEVKAETKPAEIKDKPKDNTKAEKTTADESLNKK